MSAQVVLGVGVKRPGLVRVREFQEPKPSLAIQSDLFARDGRARIDFLVARHHAASEKRVIHRIDGVLKVPVQAPLLGPAIHRRERVVDVDHVHEAAQSSSAHEAQRHAGHDAKEPVAADRQAEQVRVLSPRAIEDLEPGRDDPEAFDVGDDRRHVQPAPVDVRRQRAAERQIVRPGLFLRNRPPLRRHIIHGSRGGNHLRPAGPGADGQPPTLDVQHARPGEPGRVHRHRVRGELLPAHGVPAAHDAHPLAALLGPGQRVDKLPLAAWRLHAVHARGVEPRVDVVQDAGHVLVNTSIQMRSGQAVGIATVGPWPA